MLKEELMKQKDNLESLVDVNTQDLHETQKKLKNAHIEIETILSSLVNILIGVSLNDRVTHWNMVAENTFGVPSSEVLNKSIMMCNIDWEWDRVYQAISKCICEDKPEMINDIQYKNVNGKLGYLGLAVNPLKDENGEFKGFMISGIDITDRKIMEEHLFQVQKLESIGQLAAGIAHEINTPIQYIINNAHFLKDSFSSFDKFLKKNIALVQSCNNNKDNLSENINKIKEILKESEIGYLMEEIPKAIDQSLEGLEHISKIVQAIKMFAHPGSKKRTCVDINLSIENAITISQNEWKDLADVITNFDNSLPLVSCYLSEFNQVLLNLIINAAHAIEEKISGNRDYRGKITISTLKNNSWVEIIIEDTGNGIPDDIRSKVFDPFFTTKEINKGTGQGLSLSHSVIVNMHGGMITFDSEVGKGTTFVIKLPINENKVIIED